MAGKRYTTGLTAFLTALLFMSANVQAMPMSLDGAYARLNIDPFAGAGVQSWQVCRQRCDNPDNAVTRHLHGPATTPLIRLHAGDTALDQRLRKLDYREIGTPQPGTLILLSDPVAEGVRISQRYRLLDHGRRLSLSVDFVGAGSAAFRREHQLSLQLAMADEFGQSASAGFTGLVESARWLTLTDGEVVSHAIDESLSETEAADWAGIRNRFWTLLASQPDGRLTARSIAVDQGYAMSLSAQGPLKFELFAGPVEPAVLSAQPGELQALWIAGLWDWLRWLAMGLYYLLESLTAVIGDYGLAIIALALSVKILMSPLTIIAGRWQQQVNTIQAQLQPELRRIKAEYRGEEQAKQVMALHRAHGVTPFYPVRSLFGVLIQLPVFIGAFDMLLHHPGLAGIDFLWVADLARPDHLLALPFTLPFFGSYLNLLPFLMTGINLIAAHQSAAAGLDAADHRHRQQWLYGMALLFLVLFYTFPAGMVLYWTSTNLFHVLGEQFTKRRLTGART